MELHLSLLAVEQRCPEVSRVYALGQRSVRGFPLWVLEMGPHPGAHWPLVPEVKYVANMHGNEAVGRELLLLLAEDLCRGWRRGEAEARALLASTRIHLLPSMNPDGWQTATESGHKDYLTGRANNNSVDLNRDFPDLDRLAYAAEAQDLPQDHLLDQLPVDLRSQLWEHEPQPETLAIMQWLEAVPFVLSGNLHGGDLVVNYPYDSTRSGAPRGYSASPDDNTFRSLAHLYADAHPRMSDPNRAPCVKGESTFGEDGGITNGAAWYSVSGGMQDYNYLASNCFELTVELGCDKYPPGGRLPSLWGENRAALYAFMWGAHTGVKGLVTDAISGLPIAGAVISVTNVTERGQRDVIAHDVTTARAGDYYRLLTPGHYTITASSPAHLPLTHRLVLPRPLPHAEATRRDFSLVPASELGEDVSYEDLYNDVMARGGRW